MKVLAFSGSLRKDSYNTALIRAVQELAPDGMEVTTFDLTPVPMYDQDAEAQFPAEAQAFKDAVEAADAIVIATPEYNRSIPGVLKNAIDWASRPWGKNSFTGKSTLVLGASMGPHGTMAAQQHLKQVMLYLDAHVVGQPEFYLGDAMHKFDEEGTLTDEQTKEVLVRALEALKSRVA